MSAHIANGLFGAVVIDPPDLPAVDKSYVLVQSEHYYGPEGKPVDMDKLQNLVCNKAFRSDLIEGIGEGFEYLAKLDGLLDLAMEFDGGRLEPEYKQADDDDGKPIYPATAIDQAKKTQPGATAEVGKQLDLIVDQ